MSPTEFQTRKKVCYYKWEFLRRNLEYREDYKAFLELCGRNNWDPKSGSARYETFEKKPDRQMRYKYGIAFLEYPDRYIPMDNIKENPFWPLLEDRGLKRPTWPSILRPHYPKGEPVIRTYGDSFKDKIPDGLTLNIDLTYPKSEIMARVKKLVDDTIETRKKLGLDVHRSRKRFDLYGQYLKIWDLRGKGLTYKEIAAKLYPDEPLDYELESDSGDEEFNDEQYERRVEELIGQGEPYRKAHEIADEEFGIVVLRKNPTIQRIIVQYREAKRLVEDGYKGIF